MADFPKPVVLEVVERRDQPAEPGSVEEALVIPNEVRINGQPLWMDENDPIIVHEINVRAHGLIKVTLTLVARRIVIGADKSEAVDTDA